MKTPRFMPTGAPETAVPIAPIDRLSINPGDTSRVPGGYWNMQLGYHLIMWPNTLKKREKARKESKHSEAMPS
jgi:hypothetical protein